MTMDAWTDMKIYVASSWRNEHQPRIVKQLRRVFGPANVYDFRNPAPGVPGFKWSAIDPQWEHRNPSPQVFIAGLFHPAAEAGFKMDFDAMQAADVCVLVLPAGRSACLEAGWMKGAGKRLVILTREGEPPDLMFKMADAIVDNDLDLAVELKVIHADLSGYIKRVGHAGRRPTKHDIDGDDWNPPEDKPLSSLPISRDPRDEHRFDERPLHPPIIGPATERFHKEKKDD